MVLHPAVDVLIDGDDGDDMCACTMITRRILCYTTLDERGVGGKHSLGVMPLPAVSAYQVVWE